MQSDISNLDFNQGAESIQLAKDKVNVRIKQRNGRKSITIIDNIPNNVPVDKILKMMRKNFHCSGCSHKNNDNSSIELSGDQRLLAKKMLIDVTEIGEENIVVHGY